MGQAAPESGPPTVETRQLQLRKPQPSDVDALFEIQGNADAMRHTYVAPDRDATARYLQAYAAHFSEDGFAPWTALAKSDLRVVGFRRRGELFEGFIRFAQRAQRGPQLEMRAGPTSSHSRSSATSTRAS